MGEDGGAEPEAGSKKDLKARNKKLEQACSTDYAERRRSVRLRGNGQALIKRSERTTALAYRLNGFGPVGLKVKIPKGTPFGAGLGRREAQKQGSLGGFPKT